MGHQYNLTPIQHYGEIRNRVKFVVIFFLFVLTISFFLSSKVIKLLISNPVISIVELNAFSPFEGIKVLVLVSIILACVPTLPFLMFQIWFFLKPGLTEKEKKSIIFSFPIVPLLFLFGLAFSYFIIFPNVWEFSNSITNKMGLTMTYGVSSYFSFLFVIVIPLSIFFETPLLFAILTKFNVISPQVLLKSRKIIYLVLIFIAALITPPDIILNVLVSIPLILIFEVSVLISNYIYKRNKNSMKGG